MPRYTCHDICHDIYVTIRNQVHCFLFFELQHTQHTHTQQVPRNKSKKGGVKRRVYFWGGISWFFKTPGVAWTAADIKVEYRHTKNLCVGTVFQEEDEQGNPCVYRVVETRAGGDDNFVSYVPHFAFPDATPPEAEWSYSTHAEVKKWHDDTRATLAQHPELQPPTTMQDTEKTLDIYREALYPTL